MPEGNCRICIVVPDLRLGGAQRVLLTLAGQFAGMGHRVTIVSLLGGGALAGDVPAGVSSVTLFDRQPDALFGLRCLLRLRTHFRRHRYDAVLSSMTGTNLVTVVAHRLARSGARLVLREAASLVNLDGNARRWLMRWLYPRADAVIAVSDGVRKELVALGIDGTRAHAVRNPVSAVRLRCAAAGQSLPAALDGRPYVVSVGRLVRQKDHETLLRAFAGSRLPKSHDLVIVGEGEQRGALSRLADELGVADRLMLLGALTNPYAVMSHAALLVLSSRWEGYPNVLLESLALGISVVATDAPWGAAEMLGGGRYGLLVPVADPEALGRAIEATLDGEYVAEPWPERMHAEDAIALQYFQIMFDTGSTFPVVGMSESKGQTQ